MIPDSTQKKILCHLSDKEPQTSGNLSYKLNLGEATIMESLAALQTMGIAITEIPGKGFTLPYSFEFLDELEIRSNCAPATLELVESIEILDEIDSTNSYLIRKSEKAASRGAVCLAESQSSGRGRVGRNWISPYGSNIYLSLAWIYDDQRQINGLSLAAGVSVVRVLHNLGFKDAGLKWPNDILYGDCKLGGILLEIVSNGNGLYRIVLGLGLNVFMSENSASQIDQRWIDLHKAGQGRNLPSRNSLVSALINELMPLLESYPRQGLASYIDEWRSYHSLEGRRVQIQQGANILEGYISGISNQGLLKLVCLEGNNHEVASGDVRLRALESA